ncbi:hypothetical protein LQW54_010788 [Pestalotiopsis sp. IQ-011]
MFVTKVAVAALSALTLVSAGNSTFSIDPDSVTLATRATWCTSEKNVCGQICSTSANTCDVDTLDYTCTCTDGSSPDLNEYTDSMPYHICETAFANCISANAGDATGQENCTTTISDECGTKVAGSTTTTSAASSSSGTGTATAASTASATSSSSTAGAMPTGIQHLPNGAIAVAAGFLAYAAM